jgi:Delta14-sterol reductase
MSTTTKSIWHVYVASPSMYSIMACTGYFLAYFVCMFLAARFFPNIQAKSPKKVYGLTGLYIFLATTILLMIGYIRQQISLLFIVENYLSLFIVMNVFAIVFSIYLFQRHAAVKNAPNANKLVDYWHGREKDPMLFGVDLKIFFYQPSLIGLALVNTSLAEAQWSLHGRLSIEMIVYQIFWYVYLLTHYIREDFMLWTFDIIEDHFGLMLVWGDLIYVPFLYSIAGWYVADNVDQSSSIVRLVLIVVVHVIGHYIFRVSNWQKFDVRKDRSNARIWGKTPVLLDGRLLISGFWGIGRHVNYTGEILVYFSIALCAGMISYVPYILPFSLSILLAQRAHRDDQRCRKKYGEQLWQKYCRTARFRMIPLIY